MAFNAVILLLWWMLFPSAVVSNGGQVFFILLWLGVAWGIYLGEGWIRVGLAAIVIAFAWGLINQPSILEGLGNSTFAEVLSKLTALIAVVLLYLPPANLYFRESKERKAIQMGKPS